MGVSAVLGNSVLDHTLKGVYETWVSLHTAVPVAGGASNEVTGTNYARELVNPTDWTTPASSASSNAVAVTFNTAGSNWGTVTHVGIFSASSGGSPLWWGALAASRVVNTGETLSFSIGNLTGTVI
jgi:hypothetical protein